MSTRRIRAMLAGSLVCLLGAGSAHAVPVVSVYAPANVGINAATFSFGVVGNTITLNEEWDNTGPGYLLFEGLEAGVNYTVVKNITNNSGSDWTRLANELLDPSGDQEDTNNDPMPYPAFVPAGFSTSSDIDGLSFAQGSGLPRTSDIWDEVFVDELTDARDFLDYFDGTLVDTGSGSLTFGLRDNSANNQPFLLVQRPNVSSRPVPEPTSILLIGLGLLGMVMLARRRGSGSFMS